MKKIKNIQTKNYIAETIRNEILSGNMEPGEELTQELLAEMLGVSRMPVREALQMLEQEGFIERLPNRHMVVAELDADKIRGIIRMVAAMEIEIISQGIGTEGEEPDQVLEFMGAAIRSNDCRQAMELELEYHTSLAKILKNTYLEQMFTKALEGYIRFLIEKREHNVRQSYDCLKLINEHRHQGDPDAAGRLLREYYQILTERWDKKGSS